MCAKNDDHDKSELEKFSVSRRRLFRQTPAGPTKVKRLVRQLKSLGFEATLQPIILSRQSRNVPFSGQVEMSPFSGWRRVEWGWITAGDARPQSRCS